VVALVCVSGERPVLVAWRLLQGTASEKGKEAAVTRALVEQALALGGADCMRLLLADALYADGPLLAWLKYEHKIDALVRLPEDRLLYEDLRGLAGLAEHPWTRHRSLRTISGHKQWRTLEVSAAADLTSWDSFREAAAGYGAPTASLWACLIREVLPPTAARPAALPGAPAAQDPAVPAPPAPPALVSTRTWPTGYAAVQAFRPRWHSENDAYHELKEGWGLEAQRWGRDMASARGRITLTCLAFNTAQVYRLRAGELLATLGMRRLRRQSQPTLGAAPAVLYIADAYAVLALEDLLTVLGAPVRESLLPAQVSLPYTSVPP